MIGNTPVPDNRCPLEVRGGEGFLWQTWTMLAPADATLEDAQRPDFFRHTARYVKARDIIKIWNEAGLGSASSRCEA